MKPRILLVAFCAFLAGCSFEMPVFDAGKLEQHRFVGGRDQVTVSTLSPKQLAALSEWFSRHSSDWKKSYVDAGPAKFVYLSRGGSAVAYFNLSANVLYAASYSRILAASERQELEAILDEKNG